MSISPLLSYFKETVIQPLAKRGEGACCSAKGIGKRIYQVAASVFSGAGNWPFYGVASSFGNRYSKVLGAVLGGAEFSSYFVFRIRNFQEIFQNFFGSSVASVKEEVPTCTSRCKSIAAKTGIAALGILAQFPLMVLTYYGNDENLMYPILSGSCESAFTILSLLLSFQSLSGKKSSASEIEISRTSLLEQVDRFIEELPEKYHDVVFASQLKSILARGSSQELLDLILDAKGLPPLKKGSWDPALLNFAKGFGFFISCYVTAVNGAVTYQGIKNWKADQEILAIATTAFVSLANIQLLTKLCVDSSVNYYEGLRDLCKGQYRAPLAKSAAPIPWLAGRIFANLVAVLSFGTTGTAARDYVPKIGNILMGLAPVSSALILHENLNWTSDDILLAVKSKWDPKTKLFSHLQDSLLKFKEQIQNAGPETLKAFLEDLPDLKANVGAFNMNTPLLGSVNSV